MDRGTERNEVGGGGGCMESYSYLALSPILTPSLACAWITDNPWTRFSTSLSPLMWKHCFAKSHLFHFGCSFKTYMNNK